MKSFCYSYIMLKPQTKSLFCFSKGLHLDVDELHDALVLDYDIEKKRVYLSLDSNIVRKRKDVTVGKKKVRNRSVSFYD